MQADVIMDLAGSNGGSWATAFSSKSSVRLHHDTNLERNSSHHGGQLTSTRGMHASYHIMNLYSLLRFWCCSSAVPSKYNDGH